jgi:hypothetical protein
LNFARSQVSGLDLTRFWSEKFQKNMEMVVGSEGGDLCARYIHMYPDEVAAG